MLPSHFTLLDSLPRTPNGKVDRLNLPGPHGDGAEHPQSFVAARTPSEFLIAEIWKDVLGVRRVSVYDSFVDLGGHSLLAMQVTTRLKETTGLLIDPSQMMLQTLGQLAFALQERLPRDPKS
ncbi:MAG: hypothetical protein H0V18_13110 [Pyrinomonadaceae bacterium]|jgi:acyl carrier protein|nr:hypothetical protein [Pyrinomonadaceae bacterium]